MIEGYYKLIILNDEVRAKNSIKTGAKTPRFDCIEFSGNYKGLEAFKSKEGIFKLSLVQCSKYQKCNPLRMAKFSLTGIKNVNFSGLFGNCDHNYYYGNPNGRRSLKNGSENPLLPFKNDLYIFKTSKDFNTLEIFILPNQKGHAVEILERFIEGDFDDEIEEARGNAKPFYDYGL